MKRYIPVCPRGYSDCVYDPAYILFYYPEWYHSLYQDKTPIEVIEENNECTERIKKDPNENNYCYDNEDK